MKFKWAMAIELAGIALVLGCSFVELPLVSRVTGIPYDINWGDPNASTCACDAYAVNVGNKSFDLHSPPSPAAPGPYGGQTVEVDYLDLAAGAEVLSVIAGPGLRDSVTYLTPTGAQFYRDQSLHSAGLAGLLAGLLLTGVGAAFVIRAVRRRGAPTGAVAAGLAPISVLGVIPLAGDWLGAPALAITAQAAALVWIVAAPIALVAGIAGRQEKPPEFARRALVFVSVTNGIWIVWWIGGYLSALGRAMF